MRALIYLLFFIIPFAISAQQPLSQSAKSSPYRYIYQLTASEALSLYKSNLNKISDSYLHTVIDSFPAGHAVPTLKEGNYLLLQALGNRLEYELLTVGDINIKLINNRHDMSVILHDKIGTSITNAKVQFERRPVKYDPITQSYRLNSNRRSGNLQVLHEGVAYFFPIQAIAKHKRRSGQIVHKAINAFPIKYITKTIRRWQGRNYYYNQFFNRPTPFEANYRGFMTFNKPIYKPGDTVKLKAFVTRKNGKGLNEKLLVRITDRNFDVDTIIAVLKPYRPGGFVHEFILSDSLELDLDEDYLITLEKGKSKKFDLSKYEGDLDDDEYAAKRKVVMRGRFRHEEYELQSIHFTARSDKKEHNRGNTQSIFLKATDENDLPVMDGRIQITVLSSSAEWINFNGQKVFLPDTLWSHSQALEAVGETKIVLPDSIFPSASFNYRIECTLLNSNNERHSKTLYTKFIDKAERLSFLHREDSLAISLESKGKTIQTPATIYAIKRNGDTLQTASLYLPGVIKLNPFVSYYKVQTAETIQEYHPNHTKGMVSAMATRTKDSLFIFLNNPHRLPVWYTLFAGNRVVARGHSDTLTLNTKTHTPKNYSLSLQYVFGNNVYSEDYNIPFQDKLLKLTIIAPAVVYPGQTTTVEVGVFDAMNRAVEGADVTAYAFTKKFTGTHTPNIPYLGKVYPIRKPGYLFETQHPKDWKRLMKLNWERWSKELGLDTLEYYKFLYPTQFYRNKENVTDSITQIAPFVVIQGEIQPIHLLYIDERPYYFSKSQHLQRYSFRVAPGKHSLRIRTHDRIITWKDVEIPRGVKTILSINGDTSNHAITVQKAPDTLTIQERALLAKYTILIQSSFGENVSYIQQGNELYLLPRYPGQGYHATPIVGPLMPHMADLVIHESFKQPFEVEGGYLYQIRQGLIKQKQANANVYIGKWLSKEAPFYNFSDMVLTGEEIETLWQQYLDHRSADSELFVNENMAKKGSGSLRIDIHAGNKADDLFVKNIFLFSYDNTDFIRVFRGKARDLGFLTPGMYRLFVLLKGDNYLIKDSIHIRKDGINYYAIQAANVKPKDSISIRLAEVLKKRELANRGNTEGLDIIKESFHSGFLDVSSFHHSITGQVRDEKGKPVPFAIVSIKGTRLATQADANGYYRLQAPEKGTVVFSSVGYLSTEQPITNGQIDAILVQGNAYLQEVVVTGFAVQRKASLTASVSVSNGLMGSAPGIQIRGVQSMNAANAPLIVIDGVPFAGSLDDLDPAIIGNVTLLKDNIAQALYGARAANGAIVVTTKKAGVEHVTAGEVSEGSSNSLRKRFKDDAYWQPVLRTDKDGKVKFSATFPDDITNWRTYAIAMGNNRQTGFAESMIRSFRPISANLALPAFSIENDSINIIGKMLNYGSDSIQLARKISINNQLLREGTIRFNNSFIDTVSIRIATEDSVSIQLEIQKQDGYYDGEERTIPVFRQGVLETKGVFAALEEDTTLVLDFDPALGNATIHAEASLFPVLLDETEKIRRYEYLCNEQLASKLKALLQQKKIYALLKKEFKEEKMILDIITRLNNGRTGLLWGWWVKNEPAPWISLHVVEALAQAANEGYKISMPKESIIDNLVFNMESYRHRDKLLSLHLLYQLNAKVDYKRYIDSLEKVVHNMTLYNKLRLLELKQKTGMPTAVDTLVTQSRQTLFGNIYWGEEGYSFFDNSIQNTVLMYRILKGIGGYEPTLRKIRNYFLEKRKDGQWRNTYESSLILEAILPDLLVHGATPRSASLIIRNGLDEIIKDFPYQKEISSTGKIQIRKEGDLPIYFTAYQQYWNKKPAAVASAFTVTTVFEKGGDTLTHLKAGEPVDLLVQVKVKGDADYVMLEVPIPAGCSYRDKPQSHLNNEVHREYFKNKVSIFCSSLKQGVYSFRIPLLARYTGQYRMNPAKAEMMYFPIFYGREGLKEVIIK